MSRGFTLIELLVVVGIIGILATLLLVRVSEVRMRGRDAKRISDVASIFRAANICFDSVGSWPPSIVSMVTPIAPFPECLTREPKHPDGVTEYGYAVSGNKIQVWAELERKNSPHNNDTDLNDTDLKNNGGVNGTLESCVSASLTDCAFDVGQL